MSGLQVAVEDRKADAVAHLAVARSQNTGPAFWGQRKIKAVVLYGRFFLLGTQFTCCIRRAVCTPPETAEGGQADLMNLQIVKEFANGE